MINKNSNIDVPALRASDNALSVCLFYFKWKEGSNLIPVAIDLMRTQC